ncbi:cyclophilin-like fold protein [Ottowia massiliensis]|uniref:cyclophilin-like fold protein n=1 Tax=Ottowia massiliensis TaxID=2045302 RepID=UPI0018EB4953|nr:hypothetical protein [Ottowia massiliensis]
MSMKSAGPGARGYCEFSSSHSDISYPTHGMTHQWNMRQMLPLTLDMRNRLRNEKYADLPASLPLLAKSGLATFFCGRAKRW